MNRRRFLKTCALSIGTFSLAGCAENLAKRQHRRQPHQEHDHHEEANENDQRNEQARETIVGRHVQRIGLRWRRGGRILFAGSRCHITTHARWRGAAERRNSPRRRSFGPFATAANGAESAESAEEALFCPAAKNAHRRPA